MASAISPSPSRLMPCPSSEFTIPADPPAKPFEPAALEQRYGVHRRILDIERLLQVLAVIEHVRHVMDLLMQAAAHRHVHFLEAAADGQHRHALGDGFRNQVQGGQIAGWVVDIAVETRLIGIMVRFDVAGRTGQQQTVQMIQQCIEVETAVRTYLATEKLGNAGTAPIADNRKVALGSNTGQYQEATDIGYKFAGLALVLMLVGGALSLWWLQRLP